MADLVSEKSRNPRDRAKLASDVSKVIRNLRIRSESQNSSKTPTRASQSPGGFNYSSHDEDDETRSFNRSRYNMSQQSMSSQMDGGGGRGGGMDVFHQGFGDRGDSPDAPITKPVPRRASQNAPQMQQQQQQAVQSPLQRSGSRSQMPQQQQQQGGGSRSASRLSYQELAKQAAQQGNGGGGGSGQYQLPQAISPTNSARSGNSDGKSGMQRRSSGAGSGRGGNPQRSGSMSGDQGMLMQQQQRGSIDGSQRRTPSSFQQAAKQVLQQQQSEQQSPDTGSPKLRRKSSAGSSKPNGTPTTVSQMDSNPYLDRISQPASPVVPPQQNRSQSNYLGGGQLGTLVQSMDVPETAPQPARRQPGGGAGSGYNLAPQGQAYDADEPNQFRNPSRNDLSDTPSNLKNQMSFLSSMGAGVGSRSSSAFEPSWIDNSIQQTTFQGIEEAEFVIRKRLWHAAMFRPKVWFQTNLLPQIRQEDLKVLASKKRRMFIELAEPNFRINIIQTANFGRLELRAQFDEGLQREELEKATLLWRTQVKGAFDRLVDQLFVEMTRKQDDLRKVVQHDTVKGANATLDKTAFSYLHLHKMFGEGLLRRSKELYVYYFGIFASMGIKEGKLRHLIAAEQNIERMMVELDRMRVFIAHVEKVEFENLVKYFQGEKRLLENEIRFKPKPMMRNNAIPAIKDPKPDLFSARSASQAAMGGGATPASAGNRSQTPLTDANTVPLEASPTASSVGRGGGGQSQFTAQSTSRMDAATPLNSFVDRRREAQSPFPLNHLEKDAPKRGPTQQQHVAAQQQHAEMVDRELRATPMMRPGSTVNSIAAASTGPKLPFQDSYLSGREMANQTVAAGSGPSSSLSGGKSQNPPAGTFYQQDAIMQKKQMLPDDVQYLSSNQVAGSAIEQTPASVIERRAGAQAYDKLGRALQFHVQSEGSDGTPTNSSTPSMSYGGKKAASKAPSAMMNEDRRRCDSDELLTTQPVRGGTVLPPLVEATGARKQREVSEGVISGLMLVSNIMAGNTAGNIAAASLSLASPLAIAEPDYAASRLPPLPGAASTSQHTPAQAVVSSIGRMLLGSTAMPTAPSYAVPTENLEVSAVRAAETDTAVALLLMLHRNGADNIRSDEANVRKSLLFFAQEHKKDAIIAAGHNRVNKFYGTRIEKAACEEAELRNDLYALERHEFSLHIQRLQWVEYYLLTAEESSDRESIVSMSHLSSAVLSKYAKQEFTVTSLMEHQALIKQYLQLYERWFLAEVVLPTSIGLRITQNERRERNKLLAVMDKELKILEKEARGIGARKEQYAIPKTSDKALAMDALLQLEEVGRRNVARLFAESRGRLVFDEWDEKLSRMAIILGREKWFRELVRPTQFRMTIHTTEQDQRQKLARDLLTERSRMLRDGLLTTYELSYRDMSQVEQREFRRLSMDHLKERRQREARQKEHLQKQENMSKYAQAAIVAAAQPAADRSMSSRRALD